MPACHNTVRSYWMAEVCRSNPGLATRYRDFTSL